MRRRKIVGRELSQNTELWRIPISRNPLTHRTLSCPENCSSSLSSLPNRTRHLGCRPPERRLDLRSRAQRRSRTSPLFSQLQRPSRKREGVRPQHRDGNAEDDIEVGVEGGKRN